MVSKMLVPVWSNWMKRFSLPAGYKLVSAVKDETMQGVGADFEGSLVQKGNKVLLHNRLALKKRVYEASDWESFRNAVNAHKAYGEYLVIKK